MKFKKGRYPRHIGGNVKTANSRIAPTLRLHRSRQIKPRTEKTLVAYKNLETGTVHLNPAIPKQCRGRVKVYEDVYWQKRGEGFNHEEAKQAALEAEHRGLSLRQVREHDLKIARAVKNAPPWNPLKSSLGNPYKVHETDRYFRVRIKNPKKHATKRTLTFSEKKGYKAVRQKPKGKTWETQSVLIEKKAGRTPEFALKKAQELIA